MVFYKLDLIFFLVEIYWLFLYSPLYAFITLQTLLYRLRCNPKTRAAEAFLGENLDLGQAVRWNNTSREKLKLDKKNE